jgi:hypothetical protein
MNGRGKYTINVDIGDREDENPDNNEIYTVSSDGTNTFLNTESGFAIDFYSLEHIQSPVYTIPEIPEHWGMKVGNVEESRGMLYRLFNKYKNNITMIYVSKGSKSVYSRQYVPPVQGTSGFGNTKQLKMINNEIIYLKHVRNIHPRRL